MKSYEIIIYQKHNYSVYVHINKINQKKYFGITSQNPEKRWNHGNGYKHNKHFYSSILKYGWDNFEHIVLFNGLTETEACNIEKMLISFYNTTNKNLGYNNDKGGKRPPSLNDEAKEKLRNIAKKRTTTNLKRRRKGYHVSEYNKQRIRETHNIPILQFTKDMTYIKEYPSLTICEKITVIKAQHISDVCNGKQKTAGGYIWIRKSEYSFS